jgi:ABC-type transporter Mla maintaining outer membrane lipid asymmetry ATPase subunit MlaF
MSTETRPPVIEIRHLVKDYRGLRPLRVRELVLSAGDRIVVLGFDAVTAETMINLITGASVPDAGEARVFGQNTAAIASGDEWLATVDRFGIVSERVVLLDGLSVTQNLAIPLTLEIEPVTPEVFARVGELARAVGLADRTLSQTVSSASPLDRARIRLARAIALGAEVLLLEHPAARLSAGETARFVEDVARVSDARGLTVLALASDARLAALAPGGPWRWDPASGEIRRVGRVSRWFGS